VKLCRIFIGRGLFHSGKRTHGVMSKRDTEENSGRSSIVGSVQRIPITSMPSSLRRSRRRMTRSYFTSPAPVNITFRSTSDPGGKISSSFAVRSSSDTSLPLTRIFYSTVRTTTTSCFTLPVGIPTPLPGTTGPAHKKNRGERDGAANGKQPANAKQ